MASFAVSVTSIVALSRFAFGSWSHFIELTCAWGGGAADTTCAYIFGFVSDALSSFIFFSRLLNRSTVALLVFASNELGFGLVSCKMYGLTSSRRFA